MREIIDISDAWEWIDSLPKDRDQELVNQFSMDNSVQFGMWLVDNYADEIKENTRRTSSPECDDDGGLSKGSEL